MRTLNLKDIPDFQKIAKALAPSLRVAIFELLLHEELNINEIASRLNVPVSTVAINIQKLEEADLIESRAQPGIRGSQKICSAKYDCIVFSMTSKCSTVIQPSTKEISIPIGQYVKFEAKPPCGMVSESGKIGKMDDLKVFYSPDRIKAQLLWFSSGFVEYQVPNEFIPNTTPLSLDFSLEICSEALGYNNKWPSNITVWVNDHEVGTWTSPGDFGGKRGKYSPLWWSISSTQYGILKHWHITADGSFIDADKVSDLKITDLGLNDRSYLTFKIGIKPNAQNIGGINIFGEKFGNYPQDLVVKFEFIE